MPPLTLPTLYIPSLWKGAGRRRGPRRAAQLVSTSSHLSCTRTLYRTSLILASSPHLHGSSVKGSVCRRTQGVLREYRELVFCGGVRSWNMWAAHRLLLWNGTPVRIPVDQCVHICTWTYYKHTDALPSRNTQLNRSLASHFYDWSSPTGLPVTQRSTSK